MDLYKIILVDDEEEVRRSIIKKVEWMRLGFEVVGDAGNGEEALELALELNPDLVLTDIRMPFMDGLELGRRLRAILPSVKIIIFSGFDDFEYAKQAISIHVVEYILKPVNAEELSEILTRVRENLNREIDEQRNIEALRNNYLKNIPILRTQYLLSLIRNKVNRDEIGENLINYRIPLTPSEQWICCVLRIDRPKATKDMALAFHNEKELVPISVKKFLDEKIEGRFPFVSFPYLDDIVIIAGLDKKPGISPLQAQLRDFSLSCGKILQLKVTVGIGYPARTLSEIWTSFDGAWEAMGYRMAAGGQDVIYIGDVEPKKKVDTHLRLDSLTEGEIFSTIKFGTELQVESLIERLLDRVQEEGALLRQYQVYLIGVLNAIVHMISQFDLNLDEIMGGEWNYFAKLSSFQDAGGLKSWLIEICVRLNEAISRERKDTAKNIVKKAKDFILNEYRNPELSVDMVCGELNISPAYFSTLFKRETGISYISYLTGIRLNKAAELLRETEDKTYMIAQRVGYLETNYFSYVFKKHFGVSPTKYRRG